MLPLFLQRMLNDCQEKQKRIREARTKIGELCGNGRVIEIGCGFGANSEYCMGPYLGIDMEPVVIQGAKKRHPSKEFLCKDVHDAMHLFSDYDTALFCAVLHEIPDYRGILNNVRQSGIPRVLICDYDPELKGWLRLWMNVFESDAKGWWGNKPEQLLPEAEWSLRSGQITRSILWWEFDRKNR